jgi:hypothetical protein
MVAHNLIPGAVIIDLVDGSIHGDLGHCPKEDLLESARALLSLLPQVRHKGLWGFGKAYDADCYLYTTVGRYKAPEDLSVSALGSARPDGSRYPTRKFALLTLHSTRADYWRNDDYFKLVGSIRDGLVSEDTTGLASHYDAEKWDRPRSDPRAQLASRVAKPAPKQGGTKPVEENALVQRRFF